MPRRPLAVVVLLALLLDNPAHAPGAPRLARTNPGSRAATPATKTSTTARSVRRAATAKPEPGEDVGRFLDPDTGKPGTLAQTRSSREGDRLTADGDDQVVNVGGYAGFQSETGIAANRYGTVLVAGFNDHAAGALGNYSGVARSIDGGRTWTASGPLATAGGQLFGDPDVKYDPVGDRFFYSSLYIDPAARQTVCVHRSDASGLNWTGPYVVTGSTSGTSDKEMIDIQPLTGRLIAVWVSTISSLMASYTDDGGATWSAAIQIASVVGGSLQAPQVRFVPGTSNASSQCYVFWSQANSIRYARSTDGGVTWSAPVTLKATMVAPDEVIGIDRAHLFTALDVDRTTGKVYVAYPSTDALGMTDIELVTGSGTSFSAPVKIDSRPSNDRAQIRPAVAVDPNTHRVHVTWYDQDGATSGDLTQLMHTWSDDAGLSWSPPTPLFDRSFHAGYGDDVGDPNLGDYNACVAVGGVLHTVAAATPISVHFDDAQPSALPGAVDTYDDRHPQGGAPFNVLTQSDVAAAPGTAWVVTADFNGDGKRDLATANDGGSVTVRFGDGAGHFGAAATVPVSGTPYAIAAADLNHDGRPDLVTANFAGTAAVLLNDGSGGFGTVAYFTTGAGSDGVAIGDVNGDSHPDVVTANPSANSISVLAGNGTGGFGPSINWASSGPNWVVLADMNADGKLDAVTANPAAHLVTVFLNNGSGGFPSGTTTPVSGDPATIAVGDVNQDGRPDVIAPNFSFGSVTVLLGNGSAALTTAGTYTAPLGAGGAAVGDFDGDGLADVALSHDSPGRQISVLRGNGAGVLGTARTYAVQSNNWGVLADDVNGDGRVDLLAANHDAGSVSVLLNAGPDNVDRREAALRVAGTTVTDACTGGANGRLEPGEVGSFTFTLENYVSNPIFGPPSYTNVVATLTSPTAGVTILNGTQSYPALASLATASNASPFRITLDPSFVPGTPVDLLLTVTTDQGIAKLRTRVPTGSPGTSVTLLSETFNGATAPALPAGWTTANGAGATVAWITSTTLPGVGSGSLAAFHANTGTSQGWNRLFSPSVVVPTPSPGTEAYLTLDFDVAYSLENEPTKKVLGYDGCFLRITDLTGGAYTVRSIYADAFAETFTTGSSLGYDHRTPRAGVFPTTNVWSGSSQGLKHVSMKFPAAGMAGHTVQLRFEFVEDTNGNCTGAGLTGPCGMSIDNVAFQYVPVISQPCTPVGVPLERPLAFGLRGVWPNPSPSGRLSVRFALAGGDAARLELFDASGRMVRAVDAAGSGEHLVELAGSARLAPGLYFVRLRQGEREATSRAVVLR